MIRNIILVGFMGTGKTTVGMELSRLLQMKFVDTDKMIEMHEGMAISDIFKSKGEKYFRELEFAIVLKAIAEKNRVVSTGGGVVLNPELYSSIKKSGIVVALAAKIDTLWDRLKHNDERPLLLADSPEEELARLYKKREPLYMEAHHVIVVDNKTPREVAKEIVERIK